MTLTNRIPNRPLRKISTNSSIRPSATSNQTPSPASLIHTATRQTSTIASASIFLASPERRIKLTLEDGQLKITAKTESEAAFRSDFDRVFDLPDDANAGEVTAKLEDGVLDLVDQTKWPKACPLSEPSKLSNQPES